MVTGEETLPSQFVSAAVRVKAWCRRPDSCSAHHAGGASGFGIRFAWHGVLNLSCVNWHDTSQICSESPYHTMHGEPHLHVAWNFAGAGKGEIRIPHLTFHFAPVKPDIHSANGLYMSFVISSPRFIMRFDTVLRFLSTSGSGFILL